MKINPEDKEQLKKWLIMKSKMYSEADSEVLADYIIALLDIDSTPEQHLSHLKEQLADFTEQASLFSEEIVKSVQDRSYIPPGPTNEQRNQEIAFKQKILQKMQEKKLTKQREEQAKEQMEKDRLAAEKQRQLEQQQRLQEERDRLEKEQEERQRQFEMKQQKKNEMIEGLQKMIDLKEKMLEKYDSQLAELQQALLTNPGDLELVEEAKLKFSLIRDEMITNHVTPEEISNDRAKLEQATKSTSMLSTRGMRGTKRGSSRAPGILRGGINKPGYSSFRNPNASYNKKLDLRTRTLTIGKISQGEFHKILPQLDVDQIECTKNDEDSGFNVTFKDRFYAEQVIKRGLRIDGAPLCLKWNELIRPGLGSLQQSN